MTNFPIEMQGDVSSHLYREVLDLSIFETASGGCLKAIAMQVKPMFCAPGEYILHKGDAISAIYFLCNGSMEILKEGMVVAILGMHSFIRSFILDIYIAPLKKPTRNRYSSGY